MSRMIRGLGLVAMLSFILGGPHLGIPFVNAAEAAAPEKAASNYCSSVPDSLRGSGWVPGNCR
jgi:hypothetical protein